MALVSSSSEVRAAAMLLLLIVGNSKGVPFNGTMFIATLLEFGRLVRIFFVRNYRSPKMMISIPTFFLGEREISSEAKFYSQCYHR